MRGTKEEIFQYQRQQDRGQYRIAVVSAWNDNKDHWTKAQVDALCQVQTSLGLSKEEAAMIEIEVVGNTKENIPVDVPVSLDQSGTWQRPDTGIKSGAGSTSSSSSGKQVLSEPEVTVPATKKGRVLTILGKFLLVVLLLFLLFMAIGAFSSGASSIGVVILIISAILFWLLVRKKKKVSR
jgi:hypothetical protein